MTYIIRIYGSKYECKSKYVYRGKAINLGICFTYYSMSASNLFSKLAVREELITVKLDKEKDRKAIICNKRDVCYMINMVLTKTNN